MDKSKRHKRFWRILHAIICPFFKKFMKYSCTVQPVPTPALVISNHVTAFDPFLVSASFPKNQMYFVASEHLFRKGFLTKIIQFLVAPIARRKGSTGADTAMKMLHTLKKGNSVCIFAEGETSWNGLNHPIFPGTGDIARLARASLITYRLQGGFFTAPRWGKGIRRGKMQGGIVRIYSPEELKNMSSQEIAEAIKRDISENAWETQKESPVRYKGKNRARYIETALFLCPKCGQYGTLQGVGNQVTCSCGFETTYTEYGTFEPAQPFENLLQWDEWQHAELKKAKEPPAFKDGDVTLMQLQQDHSEQVITKGPLCLYSESLRIRSHCFPFRSITNMALVKKNIMVFSCMGSYYELKSEKPLCLRKYLAVWQNINQQEK